MQETFGGAVMMMMMGVVVEGSVEEFGCGCCDWSFHVHV